VSSIPPASTNMTRLIQRTVYVDAEQVEALEVLARFQRRSVAGFIREGVDLVLSRYEEKGHEEEETQVGGP